MYLAVPCNFLQEISTWTTFHAEDFTAQKWGAISTQPCKLRLCSVK